MMATGVGGEKSTLRWRDTISESLAAITQRPARTALTALGTILGVGAFVTTTGLADTARAQVSSRFDALKATEVRIQDAQPDGSNPFPDDVDLRLEALNGINHAGLYYTVPDNGTLQPRATASRPSGAQSQPIPVIAATPGAIQAAIPVLSTGRVYDGFHQSRAEQVAVVGRVAAAQLGLTRIDNQPAVFVGDTAYTVIAIIDDVKRNPDLLLSIVIPTSTIEQQLHPQGATYEVIIDTQPGAANLAGRQAPTALRPQQPERLQALVPPDPKTLRNQVQGDVTSLFYALAALALFIGTIAITNATLLNTIERRPEIGLRRALGAKRSHIARQITLEAAITGVIAAVTGAALATLAVVIISQTKHWTPTITPAVLLAAPLIGLVTGAIAGLPPALKAAQTPPATTLRT
ncbi:MAG: ABC transporter permease [Actinomycetota bacterium]|jgi:putative ABC transport system permease protein